MTTRRAIRHAALILLVLVTTACAQRKVHVRMRDDGGVPQRTFSDSAPSSDEIRDLSERYGHAPERDERTGAMRFRGSFEDALPQEMDGANGWSRISGVLGDTTMWYEVPATSRGAWPRLVNRVESGILWLRIVKRWAQARYDEDRSQLIDDIFEDEFIPQIVDGYLRWVGAGAIIQSQRVGLQLRKEEDRTQLTEDELFRLQVVLPILVALATDGPLEAEELHAAFLLGIDGSASRSERDRVWKSIGRPAVLRFLRRFEPERTDVTLAEIRSWGLSILLYAASTSRYKDLMLESPAISDEDKASLRAGGIVFPPAPFGVKFLGRATPIEATLDLEPAYPAFITNGVVLADEDRTEAPSGDALELLRFRMSIPPADQAPLFGPPPAYALWSTPDAEIQQQVFGEVVLEGRELAMVASWEQLLAEPDRTQWLAAVEASVAGTSPAPMAAFVKPRLDSVPTALVRCLGLDQAVASEAP